MKYKYTIILAMVVLLGLGLVTWDRQRTVYRVRVKQDQVTIQMITVASIAYGLNDREIFINFSPETLANIARDSGVKVNDPTPEGIPVYTGIFIGYEINNDKSVNAKIRNGDNVHYIGIQPTP